MAHTGSVICFHQRPLTVFASPGRYVQGPGATHELGRELQRLGLSGRVLFVAGSASDVPGAAGVGMDVVWHNRAKLAPKDDTRPLLMADSLAPLLAGLG